MCILRKRLYKEIASRVCQVYYNLLIHTILIKCEIVTATLFLFYNSVI